LSSRKAGTLLASFPFIHSHAYSLGGFAQLHVRDQRAQNAHCLTVAKRQFVKALYPWDINAITWPQTQSIGTSGKAAGLGFSQTVPLLLEDVRGRVQAALPGCLFAVFLVRWAGEHHAIHKSHFLSSLRF
jgi:hypothetical protein